MSDCETRSHVVPSPFALLLISLPPERRAAKIRQQRYAIGVPQAVLCGAAGISRHTLWIAETKGTVCARSLIAIAHALEDMADLYDAAAEADRALSRCRKRSTGGSGRQG